LSTVNEASSSREMVCKNLNAKNIQNMSFEFTYINVDGEDKS